jgi:hypothetical protein
LVNINQYSGWSFDGRAGITANNSEVVGTSMTFPTTNVGFVQDSSYLSQTVLVPSSGSYSLSFSAANAHISAEPLEVLVDGVAQSVGYNGGAASISFTPTSGTFQTATATLSLSAGPHTISFVGMSNISTYTALVTNVSLLGVGISDGDFSGLGLATGSYQVNPTQYSLGGGDVAGNLQATYVQQGQQDSAIKQEALTYSSNTAGGATIYPLGSVTVYGNADGSDARTTNYSYSFFTGTNQIQSQTTTAVGISSAQNGPGTSSPDVSSTYYDPYGNATWTKDGGGFLNFSQFDPLTGGLLKHIDDVNTQDVADFSGLPSGWTTPTGGGLELVTSYSLDPLGRPTQIVNPNEQPARRGEKSLYDSEGGEWRPHLPDSWHNNPHWDYKPPGPNQPWQNIGIDGTPIP